MSSAANFGAPVAGSSKVRSPCGCTRAPTTASCQPWRRASAGCPNPRPRRPTRKADQMAELAEAPIPEIEQAQSRQGEDGLQPFAVQPVERIALAKPGMVGARGREQALLKVEGRVLQRILDRPEAEDPGERAEDGGQLLALLDRRVSGGRPAQCRPRETPRRSIERKPYTWVGRWPVSV